MNIFDSTRRRIIELKIALLKKRLADSDYKIIKCAEYQLTGKDLPYDVAALHTQRQALRDKINTLEKELE